MKRASAAVRPRVVLGAACSGLLLMGAIVAIFFRMATPPARVPLLNPPPGLGEALQSHKEASPIATADYGLALMSQEGDRTALKAYKGRVILLNVWQTKCGPCLAEMPSLNGLCRKLEGASNISILCACNDEGMEKVKEELKVALPFYRVEGELPDCFKTRSFPVTFIIDRRGNIMYRHWGAAEWDDESVVKYLKKLAES